MNAFTYMLFSVILFINTILMLQWGIRLGKALLKDIPPSPIIPVVKAFKKVYRVIKSKVHKSYYQKKPPKQSSDENPLWQ